MTILTLQDPTYQAPATNILTYGQAGGTPSHRFFTNTPGRQVTLDEGFTSQGGSRLLDDPYTQTGPNMALGLAGAGASFLANEIGQNAGQYAFDELQSTGVEPGFLDSLKGGGETTYNDIVSFGSDALDNASGFITDIPDTLTDFGTYLSGGPSGTTNVGSLSANVPAVNSILGETQGLYGGGSPLSQGISRSELLGSGGSDFASSVLGESSAPPPPSAFTGNTQLASTPEGGNVLSGQSGSGVSISAAPGTPVWSGGDFKTNFQYGGFQSGLLGGGVSLGLGLLMGQDFKTAAKSAAGSGVGTAVGYSFGGPIGGFIGGTIGSMFCYMQGTPIEMEDGTTKAVEDLRLGDRVFIGGTVITRGEAYSDEIFEYKDVYVSGGHAVFEHGIWIRVRDSALSTPVSIDSPVVVYPICTENYTLVTSGFISADLNEVPNTSELTDTDRLAVLNMSHERNEELFYIELPNRGVHAQSTLFDHLRMGPSV